MANARSELKSVRIRAYPIDALRPAEWNPKTVDLKRLENLKESIDNDPDMMWERPVLAQADGTIYAGNQRWTACKELGWEEIPAILEDVSEELARERALKDNRQWGEWNDEAVTTLLQKIEPEVHDTLGFTDAQLIALMKTQQSTPIQPDTDPDATYVENKGDRGKTPAEIVEKWTEGATRMVVLYYRPDQYERASGILEVVRDRLDMETNAEAVLQILEEYHANYCAGTGELEPE